MYQTDTDPNEQTKDSLRVLDLMSPIKLLIVNGIILFRDNIKSLNFTQMERKINWEFEVFSGINFTKSYLYSDYNLVSLYDVELSKSERLLQTQNVGFNVYADVGKFQWGLGLFFSSLGEQGKYAYIEQEETVNPLNGNVELVNVDAELDVKNEYRFWHVPFSVGYVFSNDHFSLIPRYSLSAGMSFKEQVGYYPNRDGIGIASVLIPKWNVQQNIQLSLRAQEKNLYISITPYMNFNSIKTPPEIVSYRKYMNFGLNVGLGIKIK